MRIALAAHEGRISPVLDVARRLVIIDLQDDREAGRQEAALAGASVAARVASVQELGVDVLLCGALSRPLEAALVAAGVRLIPHICGDVDEIAEAFRSGNLADGAYVMPGCCGRRRQQRGRQPGHAGGGRRGRGQCARDA